jgi:hypothetical protein
MALGEGDCDGKKSLFSFNFKEDHWRAATVRGIGSVEGNAELSDNDWEAVKKKGAAAVENWIDGQMQGKSCVVVLVGANTANRPWIDYEIKQAWKLKKGLVGIRIHKLLNSQRLSSVAGTNPFNGFKLGEKQLSSIVTLYDPPGVDGKAAYKSISDNIGDLIETAIKIRDNYT